MVPGTLAEFKAILKKHGDVLRKHGIIPRGVGVMGYSVKGEKLIKKNTVVIPEFEDTDDL